MTPDGDNEEDVEAEEEYTELTDISGVGPSKAESLREAGFESVEDVRGADQSALADVSGSGTRWRPESRLTLADSK